MLRKWLNGSQPELEEKQRLLCIIDSKLEIEFTLAEIRQEPGTYELAEKDLQCNADILAQKLPNDDLVYMAMVIS